MLTNSFKIESRIFLAILVATVLLLCITGCGGSVENEPKQDDTELAAQCKAFTGPVTPDSPCWIYHF